MAMTLIGTANLNSGNTTGSTGLTITNIPQTYKDLLIIASLRGQRGGTQDGVGFALNENSSTYSYIGLHYNGGITNQNTNYESFWAGAMQVTENTASAYNNHEIYIPNYTNLLNKSYIQTSVANSAINAGASQISMTCNVYTTNTNAVTSFRLQSATANGLTQYSSVFVYGIN